MHLNFIEENKYPLDENGVWIIDKPLLSMKRVKYAICLWFYLAIICELDYLSFIEFLIYAGRPYMSQKKGKY